MLDFERHRIFYLFNLKQYIKSTKLADKEQPHPSSEYPATHHQLPQVRNSFLQTRIYLTDLSVKIFKERSTKRHKTNYNTSVINFVTPATFCLNEDRCEFFKT